MILQKYSGSTAKNGTQIALRKKLLQSGGRSVLPHQAVFQTLWHQPYHAAERYIPQHAFFRLSEYTLIKNLTICALGFKRRALSLFRKDALSPFHFIHSRIALSKIYFDQPQEKYSRRNPLRRSKAK